MKVTAPSSLQREEAGHFDTRMLASIAYTQTCIASFVPIEDDHPHIGHFPTRFLSIFIFHRKPRSPNTFSRPSDLHNIPQTIPTGIQISSNER